MRKTVAARKLNREKVLELHSKGLSTQAIADHQDVSHSTVWRFLERMKPEAKAVEEFRTHRADILARIQAKSLALQERIIDSMDGDGVLTSLTAANKNSLLMALNAQNGTLFDKERLERGQSTQNHSLITRMMGPALKEAGKDVSTPNESS